MLHQLVYCGQSLDDNYYSRIYLLIVFVTHIIPLLTFHRIIVFVIKVLNSLHLILEKIFNSLKSSETTPEEVQKR